MKTTWQDTTRRANGTGPPVRPKQEAHTRYLPLVHSNLVYFSGKKTKEKTHKEKTNICMWLGQFITQQYHRLFPLYSKQPSKYQGRQPDSPFEIASFHLSFEGQSHSAEASRTPAPSLSPEPEIEAYKRYIDEGLNLISKGQYETAIQYFQNQTALTSVGYSLGNATCTIKHTIPTEPKAINKLVAFQASHSMCHFQIKRVDLSNTCFIDDENRGCELRPKTEAEQAAFSRIRQEEALVHAEEHLHVLQALLGENITYKSSTEPDADEIDIALTLKSKAVPMTQSFLSRYDRCKYVQPYTSATGGSLKN